MGFFFARFGLAFGHISVSGRLFTSCRKRVRASFVLVIVAPPSISKFTFCDLILPTSSDIRFDLSATAFCQASYCLSVGSPGSSGSFICFSSSSLNASSLGAFLIAPSISPRISCLRGRISIARRFAGSGSISGPASIKGLGGTSPGGAFGIVSGLLPATARRAAFAGCLAASIANLEVSATSATLVSGIFINGCILPSPFSNASTPLGFGRPGSRPYFINLSAAFCGDSTCSWPNW
ncbi:hypothetical protein ES703_07539 [subsurface metagenome]